MRLNTFLAFFCLLFSAGIGSAETKATGLSLHPAEFELLDARSRQQLVLTGTFEDDTVRDLTHKATYVSSDPAIVKVEQGIVIPTGTGSATVTAEIGALKTTTTVTVKQIDAQRPVSFQNETLAALTKSGCNMGACHGSPSGKGGFRLSLRGYDPPLDILTLRSESYARRTNVMEPDASLILRKPLMEVSHAGGRRLRTGDASHTVLRTWIAEGLKLDAKEVPTLQKIEVFPRQRVLNQPAEKQQLTVTGTFSDGSKRDLTALTVFSSSNENVAGVDELGLVEKTGRGESAILARYLDKMDTSYLTFLEEVPGFAWNNPAEHNFIDQIAFSKMKQLQILPSEICNDEEFLRRATLDGIGRLPSISETQAFLNDESPDKRNRLIDRLLDSEDYATFWTLKWSDVLRANSKKLKPTGVHKFNRWLFESVRTDKPLDQLAQELLTARGSTNINPAANYWRASRDPLDATETTAQLFLGIRIQCAKCHNHPFERWSQDNYYGIAAAFARIGRKDGAGVEEEIIFTQNSGEVKQPRTGETMKVHLLLKGDVDVPAEEDRREVFADWLTSEENPFFAKATVNRIWGHLLGRGIVEPVDDFRDSNPPSNTELLNTLSKKFAENNFSQKWAIRTIMQSRLYQLSSKKNQFNAEDEIYNSHASTRLLSAEQLLDAICQVTDVPEKFAGVPVGMRATQLADPPANHYFLKIFGQPQREMACECERSDESNLSQALQMINGPVVHNKLRDSKGRIAKMMAEKKSDEEIITTLYLSAVARPPAEAEMAAAKAHIANSEDRKLAMEDVGWAILNSKEFLFQH
ncbi:MAG: DUF1553 domain-containing protein [Planctomycetaceae bacterium]|jgi:hypothetical protein|nr:DUF1553 domain-containing protein [bacterium]MDC0273324.1 DUF1553 domain-containing protein [Planctomycetaceae bacterium]MDG2391838.1 DUF1553 domain-containing protein [Planctomycetaceae bacterium]